MIPDPNPEMSLDEFCQTLSDEQKLEMVCMIIDKLTPESKNAILQQLAKEQPQGDTQLNVTSNDKLVRLEFGRALAWFVMPRAHAIQLGILLMTHGGANVSQIPNPTQSRVPGKP